MRQNLNLFLLAGACLSLLAGCRFNNAQLTTCQAEKEQLLTAIRTQRDSNQTLKTQVASLESRLDQAEKELARGSTPTRLSSVPPRNNEPSAASPPAQKPTTSPPAKADGLPWRSPSSKPETAAPPPSHRGDASPSPSRTSLVALTRRDRRLQFDPDLGAARVDLPIDFENQSATLSAEGKRQLDEFSRLLKSSDARDLRVMIAGHAATSATGTDNRYTSARQLGTARAQAVADYLDRHGIAHERLAVSGASSREGSQNSIEVYLLDADSPAVASWPTEPAIRR